jgi:hypothetical protein
MGGLGYNVDGPPTLCDILALPGQFPPGHILPGIDVPLQHPADDAGPPGNAVDCDYSPSKKNVLLIGMVKGMDRTPMDRRDNARCVAIEGLGYNVYTLDTRESTSPNHIQGDVRCIKRSLGSWQGLQENLSFVSICLDFVWMPTVYLDDSFFSDQFFRESILELRKRLLPGGNIYLPASPVMFSKLVNNWKRVLKDLFSLRYIREDQLGEIPLVVGTNRIDLSKYGKEDMPRQLSTYYLSKKDVLNTHGVDQQLIELHPGFGNVRFIALQHVAPC